MKTEGSVQDSRPMAMRLPHIVESPMGTPKKDKDSIMQLRNEFKAAIRDIRNDVCTLTLTIY